MLNMGMTLEDIRMMEAFHKNGTVVLPSMEHEKTIFGVNKMIEQEIRKVIQIEAEWFVSNNTGYIFTDIKVKSKGNNSVTYNLIFVKQKDAREAVN